MLDVDTTLARRKPEIRVHIDRIRRPISGSGWTALPQPPTMVGGEEVTRYKEADDQYVVRCACRMIFGRTPGVISELYVPSPSADWCR